MKTYMNWSVGLVWMLSSLIVGCQPELNAEPDEFLSRTIAPDGGDWPADEFLPRGLNRTESGYYSWEQPPSSVNGWEGRCGQTAIANLAWYCGFVVSPDDAIRLAPDITPGMRPGSMARALNGLANGVCGNFRVCRPDTRAGARPLWWLHSRVHATPTGYPTPVLITSGEELHWVTVMEIDESEENGCWVVYLEHGTETRRPCGSFVQTWELQFNVGGALAREAVFGPYTAICRDPR